MAPIEFDLFNRIKANREVVASDKIERGDIKRLPTDIHGMDLTVSCDLETNVGHGRLEDTRFSIEQKTANGERDIRGMTPTEEFTIAEGSKVVILRGGIPLLELRSVSE